MVQLNNLNDRIAYCHINMFVCVCERELCITKDYQNNAE